MVVLYVDNILIFGRFLNSVTALKDRFSARYSVVDIGEAKRYLRMRLERDQYSHTIFLNQTRYVKKILGPFGIEDCKGISTPMEIKVLLAIPADPENIMNHTEYQPKVGNIMYAMLGTRPDLAFAISALSEFN